MPPELRKAHQMNNKAVMLAYGFSIKDMAESKCVAELLKMYQQLTNQVTILDAVSFTNRIIFGRTNYSKEISAYKNHKAFYNNQTDIVVRFCREHGISYHIKDGTIT